MWQRVSRSALKEELRFTLRGAFASQDLPRPSCCPLLPAGSEAEKLVPPEHRGKYLGILGGCGTQLAGKGDKDGCAGSGSNTCRLPPSTRCAASSLHV